MAVDNVVMIVVDALRRDRVGAYSGEDLTPRIDTLAEEGEVFDHCYACVNATDASLTTIFTGLYPTHHGLLNHGDNITEKEKRYVSNTTPLTELLPDDFHNCGIDTLERWHARGFDTYLNPRKEERNPIVNKISRRVRMLPTAVENRLKKVYQDYTTGNQRTGSEKISQQMVEILGTIDSPFFLFGHYWDTHIPYVPPENHPEFIIQRSYNDERPLKEVLEPIEGSQWAKRLRENLIGDSETVSEMKRKYDAGVWKVDQSIGKIIDELKAEGQYENTAIIITSDHGESFTEHGIVFDHHGLYDCTIRVPLIIRAPGFEGREEQFVQHFDLVPTILDLLDRNYSANRFDGVSLVNRKGNRTLNRDAVFVEEGHTARKRAIRTKTHKYIKRLDDETVCRYCGISHAKQRELYALEEDPQEENNIITKESEIGSEIDNKMEVWTDSLPDPEEKEISFETDEEVKAHLKEMGYL